MKRIMSVQESELREFHRHVNKLKNLCKDKNIKLYNSEADIDDSIKPYLVCVASLEDYNVGCMYEDIIDEYEIDKNEFYFIRDDLDNYDFIMKEVYDLI